MGKVIPLNNITRLDLPPDRVLEGLKGMMESLVILGYDKQGEMVFSSTLADGGEVLWLLEVCKKKLLDLEDS